MKAKEVFTMNTEHKVYTPLGRGHIVHEFANGTLAVQLDSGGGCVFHPKELFPGKTAPKAPPKPVPVPDWMFNPAVN
jgi:hypothetical protein